MTYPSELPDVSSYVDLIDRFIGRDISAPDFEKSFLQAMKSERRTLGDPVYPILQELFEDADAYVEQAELRTEPEDLDDEQLRASALRARHALSGLGYEWVNGEFYGYRELRERLRAMGYRFSTESDSEIALHLYQERGMQAATLLRGEFAMVIADERQRAMIAVRDRFGVKPLYYAVVNGEVFFASEIKAMLALGVPAAWDLEGATGGMGRSHEKTEFAGISTVPPGCYAIAKDGDVRIYPYWDWEIPTAEQMRADTRSDAEIVDEFREALVDAVRQRLVADVEVASYLSGGIDSCAVLGLAQQEMDRPIRAFTLTFENPLYDEASIAEAQARHVGATYHPIPITGREIAESFKDAIWYAETQMFNGHGVAKYLLSRAVRAAGIKVVFTGEGADEMLGGYPYFRVDALSDDAALSAGERTALLDEMLGANAATRCGPGQQRGPVVS
jgi:asparagine synthase (glutamine-hydrolysing)